MKRFFRAVAPAMAAVVVFVLTATRCTTPVDDTLGQNFIPPHQQMKLRIDTLTPIMNDGAGRKDLLKTYLAQNDSVVSSNQGILLIGSMSDGRFGGVEASAMTDFFPEAIYTYTLSEDEDDEEPEEEGDPEYFGNRPIADSIFIDLAINDIKGDNSVEQTFRIYEMRDSLRRDSIYYFNTPIEKSADTTTLFEFTVEAGTPVNSIIRRKLEPTAAGVDFMRRIVEAGDDVYEKPMEEFHKKFYGLYIAPAPDSPRDAALYEFGIRSSSTYSEYAGMFLWAHNYEEANVEQVRDTLVGYFRFTDTYWLPNPNLNVNRTVFTYPAEISDHLNDTLPADPALATIYAQGLGGVASFIRFTDEMLEHLEGLKDQDGIQYSEIVINEARIYFPIVEPTTESMDIAPGRLGMYYTYGQPRPEFASLQYPYYFTSPYYNVTPVYGPIPMADYAYYAENSPSSTTKASYDGYIYRTQGYYKMTITNYLTLLMLYPEQTPREIWLGPEINTRARDYSQVVLRGSEQTEDPIRIVVTYTLIK